MSGNSKPCGSTPGLFREASGTSGLFGSTAPNSGTNLSVHRQPSSGGGGSVGFSITPGSSGFVFNFSREAGNSTSATSQARSSPMGFSFTAGPSNLVFGKNSKPFQRTNTPCFENSTTTAAGCFGAPVNQPAQNADTFGKSTTSHFGSATSHKTNFGNSGFGLNAASGGLFGSKPFSSQSSLFSVSSTSGGLFGSTPVSAQSSSLSRCSTMATFGTTSSFCGNFGSKPGVGKFGDFRFGTASAPSVFGRNTQSTQTSPSFGRTTTPTPGFGSSAGFGLASAPFVFGTKGQSSQASFDFGRTSAHRFLPEPIGADFNLESLPIFWDEANPSGISSYPCARPPTPNDESFGSTDTGFGSSFAPSGFGTNSQSAQNSFPLGGTTTTGFGSSTTGCAFTAPTHGFKFGTSSSSAQSSKPFGYPYAPGFGINYGSATTGGFGTVPAGTTVKFDPTTGMDTMMRGGLSTNVDVRNQCITTMKEYRNKSLEELRFEDYAAGRKGPQMGVCSYTTQSGLFGKPLGPSINVVIGNPVQSKSSSGVTGDAINDLIKQMVTNLNIPADQKVVVFSIGTVIINKGSAAMDMMEESMSLNFNPQKCITCMKECENNKSLQQQQLDDCTSNRRQMYPRPNFKSFSTTRRRALFAKRRGAPTSFALTNTTHWKPGSGANANTTSNGTAVRFFPPTSNETVVKPSEINNVQTRYQCITCMKEYENKSLEELRTEDYAANRKGLFSSRVYVSGAGDTVKGC